MWPLPYMRLRGGTDLSSATTKPHTGRDWRFRLPAILAFAMSRWLYRSLLVSGVSFALSKEMFVLAFRHKPFFLRRRLLAIW
jgi:hypothetical protein